MILDATALALAICVTIGRGYFALGRDGLLPSVFAKTSRHNTPWVGNLMVVVGGVGLILIGIYSHTMDRFIPIAGSREFSAFLVSATAGSFAIELVYLALAVAAIGLLVSDEGAWWQYLIVLVAVATPVLGFYGALNPAPHDTTNLNWLALYWALGVVVLSAGLVRPDAGLEAGADPERRLPCGRSTTASRRSTRTSTSRRLLRTRPSDPAASRRPPHTGGGRRCATNSCSDL